MNAWATSFNLFPSYLHTVCIDGRCFNLYDVVSSKAKNDLAQIAQELKEKDTVNMEKRAIFLIIGQISEQILSYDFFPFNRLLLSLWKILGFLYCCTLRTSSLMKVRCCPTDSNPTNFLRVIDF